MNLSEQRDRAIRSAGGSGSRSWILKATTTTLATKSPIVQGEHSRADPPREDAGDIRTGVPAASPRPAPRNCVRASVFASGRNGKRPHKPAQTVNVTGDI